MHIFLDAELLTTNFDMHKVNGRIGGNNTMTEVTLNTADIIVIAVILIMMGLGVKFVIGFFHEGKPKKEKSTYSGNGTVKLILGIDGMMCGQCESHVNDTIRKNFDVKKVSSSHTKGTTIIIAEHDISDDALKQALDPTGYRVLNVVRENG